MCLNPTEVAENVGPGSKDCTEEIASSLIECEIKIEKWKLISTLEHQNFYTISTYTNMNRRTAGRYNLLDGRWLISIRI